MAFVTSLFDTVKFSFYKWIIITAWKKCKQHALPSDISQCI